MAQSPMISSPLKATNEIDWVAPLKDYIRNTYGDDPDRYTEECATLNRLRQDVRGAGKDSTTGRDMLYRYYGQLELLDLRFPVDEQHIKISFTWFDAFTHKSTSQYSLAFEKASIIFNISAVLSCHGAAQARSEEAALKTAYHSFQASAGMFTYINENFLHAPSTDLSRDTVKTLIHIMLAQSQEIFLEKQVADKKKYGLLAKLASQAHYLYSQALEGTQENVNKAIFEKVWLQMVQIKTHLLGSMAQYYQAIADNDANNYGIAIARLRVAENLAKEASRAASNFPNFVPPSSNLTAECGGTLVEITKRQLANVQEILQSSTRDNDFLYHATVPAEASLSPVPKLPAAKPIPVSELYAGQDIQRITGPDLFSKIVPMAVTETASLYDEEKAKLVRAESERVEIANSEMTTALDYLRLPGALQRLKGSFDQDGGPDDEFRQWCEDVAGHEDPVAIFDFLRTEKDTIVGVLEKSTKQLDMEESVCEKMRSKHEAEWTQQPSSKLTTTLRSDIRNYREALDEASRSDSQLATKLRQNEPEFNEMRYAVEQGEVDQLFYRTFGKMKGKSPTSSMPEPNLLDDDFDDHGPSVNEQIERVEEILKKLNLLKRERNQVLKDLKDRVHNDDISQILILNKKSIANYEQQLFQQELEKFRSHQNRLLGANHKQASLLKDLTGTFNTLLQDRRVRAEQSKYEKVQRQRASVVNRFKRAYQEFLDLEAGLQSAKTWYSEMRETVESLDKNVETFVNNRRSEGAQLLQQIEHERSANNSSQAELERERLRGLMERMSMDPSTSPVKPPKPAPAPISTPRYPQTNFQGQYQVSNQPGGQPSAQQASNFYSQPYNPSQYGRNPGPTSPPPNQSSFVIPGIYNPQSPPPNQTSFPGSMHRVQPSPGPTQTSFGPGISGGPTSPPPNQTSFSQNLHQSYHGYQNPQQGQGSRPISAGQQQQGYIPPGYVYPPPPPGPPPLGPQQTVHFGAQDGGGGQYQKLSDENLARMEKQGQQPGDPWAGLNAWR